MRPQALRPFPYIPDHLEYKGTVYGAYEMESGYSK